MKLRDNQCSQKAVDPWLASFIADRCTVSRLTFYLSYALRIFPTPITPAIT